MATKVWTDHAYFMLTKIYIEALLVDDELADQVWGAWVTGLINDCVAAVLWLQFENWLPWQEGQS